VPFDLAELARQIRQAAVETAGAEDDLRRRVDAALHELRTQDPASLADRAEHRQSPPWLAGVPTEPLAEVHPAPAPPADYVVVSADGSHVDQDHHAALPCWVVNVGSATIRYGREPSAALETRTVLGYRPDDMWFVHDDRRIRVEGQLLNVRRQVAEMAALAELCEANPGAIALVDGTLLLTSISRAIQPEPTYFLREYLGHLDRIRASGSLVASYISRPGAGDVVGALRFGCCPLAACDRACRVGAGGDRPCAQLADVPDRLIFGQLGLEAGARSGIWRSTWPTSRDHYGEHAVHFFYLDAGPEVARVEVPAWVAADRAALDRLHAVLVAQSAKGDDGYPRALIEAHHKAVITAGDRRALDALLDDALAGRGYRSLASAQERAKRRRAV
jgi:hypothetical protein